MQKIIGVSWREFLGGCYGGTVGGGGLLSVFHLSPIIYYYYFCFGSGVEDGNITVAINSNLPNFQNLNDSFSVISPRGGPGAGINIGHDIHCRRDLLLLLVNSTLPYWISLSTRYLIYLRKRIPLLLFLLFLFLFVGNFCKVVSCGEI